MQNVLKLLYGVFIVCSPKNFIPEQVHLSLGDNSEDVVAMWVRCPQASHCVLSYGRNPNFLDHTILSSNHHFRSGYRLIYTHYANMRGLQDDTDYFYQITCDGNSTQIFHFHTLSKDISRPPTSLIFGDLGYLAGHSFDHLLHDVAKGIGNVLIHVGDIAYDMYLGGGMVGSQFMRKMESMASRVPYMVAPGNHEYMPVIGDSGNNYRNRFKMPGQHNNDMYVFIVGQIRYIVLNSEVYYSMQFNRNDVQHQQHWLQQQLELANRMRALHPWIVVLIHRPIYCSASALLRCGNGQSERLRTNLEDVFYRHGVDMVIVGHNHHYERSHPVYKKRPLGNRSIQVVRNPPATIYLVNGAAGNQEGLSRFSNEIPDYIAVRARENGYVRLRAFNSTHLYSEFFATSLNRVIDRFWIVQDGHDRIVARYLSSHCLLY